MHVTYRTPCSLVPEYRTSAFLVFEDQTASERQGLYQLDQEGRTLMGHQHVASGHVFALWSSQQLQQVTMIF